MLNKNNSIDSIKLIEFLNRALATEVVCVLRYTNHYYQAKKLGALNVSKQFLENISEERMHADKLAERIFQLGGIPKMGPEFLESSSNSHYIECNTVSDLIKENLVMERVAIDDYRHLLKFIDEEDVTTQRMVEDILASEEEHESELLVLEAEENHLQCTLEKSQEKLNMAYAIYSDQALSVQNKIELLTSLENEIQNKAIATEEGMLPSHTDENNGKEMQVINNLLLSLKKNNMP